MTTVEKYPVTFIHGDNLEFLRQAKEDMLWHHWHMGIVDPPYGIEVTGMGLGATAKSKPKTYERGSWDAEVPTQEYWDLLNYCCRDLIVWGGNYFVSYFGRTTNPATGKPDPIKDGRCFYAWNKGVKDMSFADCELALTTLNKSARIIDRSRNKRGNDDGDKRHDTQKPVYLYDYLHLENNLKGKRVLDTHGGSHTHAIAAHRNNVLLTIIEAQESFHISGIKAYQDATMKGRLIF